MAEERERKTKLLISGYIKKQKLSITIPLDIVTVVFQFYFNTFMVLKFSSTFIARGDFILSDDNKCVRRKEPGYARRYVLVDIDPVKTGIHCWRVQVIHII